MIDTSSPQVIRIPLGNGRWIDIRLPLPMSEADWAQMQAVLQAMKPGIIEQSREAEEADA